VASSLIERSWAAAAMVMEIVSEILMNCERQ